MLPDRPEIFEHFLRRRISHWPGRHTETRGVRKFLLPVLHKVQKIGAVSTRDEWIPHLIAPHNVRIIAVCHMRESFLIQLLREGHMLFLELVKFLISMALFFVTQNRMQKEPWMHQCSQRKRLIAIRDPWAGVINDFRLCSQLFHRLLQRIHLKRCTIIHSSLKRQNAYLLFSMIHVIFPYPIPQQHHRRIQVRKDRSISLSLPRGIPMPQKLFDQQLRPRVPLPNF